MSRTRDEIDAIVGRLRGRRWDPRYLAYFECFNRQLFFEAHDALEPLWLEERTGPDGRFYKGLIQLAGAFVHLQKDRLRPADALLRLAEANLSRYLAVHKDLEIETALRLISRWLGELETSRFEMNPLSPSNAPELHLLG